MCKYDHVCARSSNRSATHHRRPSLDTIMLLDDRRIVLALEAVCWITALLVFLDHTDLPAAMAVIPKGTV